MAAAYLGKKNPLPREAQTGEGEAGLGKAAGLAIVRKWQ